MKSKDSQDDLHIEKDEEAGKYPSHQEMIALNKRRLAGDKRALEEMVLKNSGLARWFADKHQRRDASDYNEVYQSALMGILKAIEKWDPKRGKFGTYAAFWIRQSIVRDYHNNDFTIRIPVYLRQRAGKIKKQVVALQGSLGRKPTLEEISAATNLSVEDIRKCFQAPLSTSSLDQDVLGGNSENYYGITMDPNSRSPGEILESKDDCYWATETLMAFFHDIDRFYTGKQHKNVEVFCRRFGIFGRGQGKTTLAEVGTEFSLTRERIRQICESIFARRARKGQYVSSQEQLGAFLDNIRFGMDIIVGTSGRISPEMKKKLSEMKWILGES